MRVKDVRGVLHLVQAVLVPQRGVHLCKGRRAGFRLVEMGAAAREPGLFVAPGAADVFQELDLGRCGRGGFGGFGLELARQVVVGEGDSFSEQGLGELEEAVRVLRGFAMVLGGDGGRKSRVLGQRIDGVGKQPDQWCDSFHLLVVHISARGQGRVGTHDCRQLLSASNNDGKSDQDRSTV